MACGIEIPKDGMHVFAYEYSICAIHLARLQADEG
jgi:hypothetical protein